MRLKDAINGVSTKYIDLTGVDAVYLPTGGGELHLYKEINQKSLLNLTTLGKNGRIKI